MIYLASPYWDKDAHVRARRYNAALDYVRQCARRGEMVFSPIVYTHPIGMKTGMGLGFDAYREFDLALLAGCSKLRVLMLRGWRASKGVSAEIEFAVARGISVEYIEQYTGERVAVEPVEPADDLPGRR